MDAKNYESQAANIVQTAEATLSDNFKNIDNVALLNQRKVLNAFTNNRVSARHFAGTNGYGYDDVGPFYKKYEVAFAPSACKHRVSGSLSLPSRGSFHLSLTVLYAIGH